MAPVLGGEVVERQELGPILLQALGGLGPLDAVGGDEPVEGLHGIFSLRTHPDLVQHRLGRRLLAFGQLVQHVDRLVHPAALLAGGGERLGHRQPEAQAPVAGGQLGRLGQAAALEAVEHLQPARFALTLAVVDRDQLLGAVGGAAH